MGKICGLKYSSVRYNEDEEEEYYFDELEDWLTEDEVEALTADCPYEIYPDDDDDDDADDEDDEDVYDDDEDDYDHDEADYEDYDDDDDDDDEEDDEMRELRIAWMKNYIQVIEEQNDGSLHI